MKPKDKLTAEKHDSILLMYNREVRPLFGIHEKENRLSYIGQLLESIRRVDYVKRIESNPFTSSFADPANLLFDPLKGAIFFKNSGDFEEACWLVFHFVYFGKHRYGGWRYSREVYGALGQEENWNWHRISADVEGFRKWLKRNQENIKRKDVPGGFGNHRKYESLDASSSRGTGNAFETYVNWVLSFGSHYKLFNKVCQDSEGDAKVAFDNLFKSMSKVISFGRTAKFDYLTMIGKLNLAQIKPGVPYLSNATGPLTGARLLFTGDFSANVNPKDLENWIIELDSHMNVGMQVFEDSLCNWQKSPSIFKPFRG
ncbi:hypothetical protein [Leptospira alstonii]|uniref:Alpha-glutamyl/putrescinyl thymine pyrophosphorylase clade 3 domain-containing protein n=2 Tax=Leptospira alstonii TaxID=28452 RepID=M6CM19_9LEPT|nr:hypothetical protein [Leptospira alstonii]EMJ91621.1 hypothetical protein LEP1GSC194_1235 [Leptospira alstonii serovar Sichuan str. 79601]EQA80410.1 hypothetical protein LEP1GSC193_0031 [Leptospira alstonii serovar Pingchang str. 80-412]